MSGKQQLMEMGFSEAKVIKALDISKNDTEQAMEWLLAHTDDPDPTPSTNETSNTLKLGARTEPEGQEDTKDEKKADDTSEAAKAEEQAQSLKCDDCGKLFRNADEVQFHAAKSGHSNFSESTEEKKPLTEEEKQAKLKEIEERLKQRRKEKENEEKEEVRQRERKRIQMSKEISETKRKYQEEEMKRIAEEKRREKLEDKKARQKVLDQIAKDKEARKQKFSNEPAQPPPKPVAAVTPTPAVKKTYDSARLQIRLPSGSALVQEFRAKEPLNAVKLWVSLNRNDGLGSEAEFTLATTFPRKVFTEEDQEKPLDILGLVPSAVLIVTNK